MADHPRIEVHTRHRLLRRRHRSAGASVLGRVPVVYTGPVDRYFDHAEGELSLAHPGLRARGAADRGLPGHPGDELRRSRRALHPDPRVPALPPGTRLPHGRDGDRARVLSLRGRAATSRTTRSTPRATARGCCATGTWPTAEPGVLFGGRLGTYQYLDMHMAIGCRADHGRHHARAALRRRRGAGQRRRRWMTGSDRGPTGPDPRFFASAAACRVRRARALPERPLEP